MAQDSKIEWTDATWNPTAGCSLVSPGCTNCYAMKMAGRLEAMGQAKYVGLTRKVNGKTVWTGKMNMDDDALRAPLSWKKPRRIFANSMSDLFHRDVPFDFIDKVFAVMALTTQHTYQVLTKRPERMAEYFSEREHPEHGLDDWASTDYVPRAMHEMADDDRYFNAAASMQWPLPNVWLGTSVENQKAADERIPHLLNCPAAVRFLSCEPLLEAVDLCAHVQQRGKHYKTITGTGWMGPDDPKIHWVIVGGESGSGARPFNVQWARDIVTQCKSAGVACFVKQLGACPVVTDHSPDDATGDNGKPKSIQLLIDDKKGGDPDEWPQDLRVREFPVPAREEVRS